MHTSSRGTPSLKRLIFITVALFIPLIALPTIQVLTNPHFISRAASSQSAHLDKTNALYANGCTKKHVILTGETITSIAYHAGMDWPTLATLNNLSNPDQLIVGRTLCLSTDGAASHNGGGVQPMARNMLGAVGSANLFPYGQCTWWAAQRYYQLHNVYVPWATNANAWQWADRARENGWQVSDQPEVGSIIDLQPNVQGASGLGHVGVVEQVLSDGSVKASNLNWGNSPSSITNVTFFPGTGVSFIDRSSEVPLS